jgi:hypothetical protein
MIFRHEPLQNKNLPQIGEFRKLKGRGPFQRNDDRRFKISSIFSLDSDRHCTLTLKFWNRFPIGSADPFGTFHLLLHGCDSCESSNSKFWGSVWGVISIKQRFLTRSVIPSPHWASRGVSPASPESTMTVDEISAMPRLNHFPWRHSEETNQSNSYNDIF